ncbi:TPT domain-containing protein [Mucor velutinosus]|uniref:TPT domain-containing protein n=1 Tax=Mucor velutinosus TaxID=708070 RepID=A0AAN7HQT1_9FUNG|nr:TPT domain-containing protein [Mucor velutinosus]
MYEELVAHHLVKREPKPKKKSAAAASSTTSSNASSNNATNNDVDHVEESPLSTLRFLVFKNYASILKDDYMTGQEQQNAAIADKALYNYLQAVKIDPTDYSLWYYIGYLSQKLHKLRFARLAYETGFYMSDQERTLKLPTIRPNDAIRIVKGGKFTIMQWRCLENLCQVLYDIGDYRLCTFYLDLVLKRNAHWEAGLQLKQQLNDSKLPSAEIGAWGAEAMETDCKDRNPITIHLEKSDWILLIKSLLDEHKRLVYKDAANSNTLKTATGVNATEAEQPEEDFFISHAIMIHVNDKEEKGEDEGKEERQQAVDNPSQQASEAVAAIPEPAIILEKPVGQEQLPKEPTIILERPVNDESDSTSAMDVDAIQELVVSVERPDASMVEEPSVVLESTANAGSGELVDQNTATEQPVAATAASATNDQVRTDPQAESSRPNAIAISDLLSQSASVPMPLLTLLPNPTATKPIVIESIPDISNDAEMTDATHAIPLKRKRDDRGDDDSASQTDTTHENVGGRDENDGEDGENEEDEEEEDEAEEKRLSLR